MKPKKPCPWCGGSSFGVVDQVRIEVRSSAKKGFGNVVALPFVMVLCKGCGATQLFADSGAVLDDFEHSEVDVANDD